MRTGSGSGARVAPEAHLSELYSFPPIYGAAKCRYGQMVYPAKDEYVGRSLALYGEFSEGEAEVFKQLVNEGDGVVEVGANLGAHTLLLARLAGPKGAVLAFEPQPVLYQTICANLALNNITNVRVERLGLGNRTQTLHIPVLDYGAKHNFGGLSLDLVDKGEPVQVRRLDSYGLARCTFIKIDVEGMEQQVLEGGSSTIHGLRPTLYVENDRKDNSPALIELLLAMDYALWWHITPLYSPDNFAGNANNVFGGTVSINMLCIPADKVDDRIMALTARMPPVTGPDDWWRK
jgi:FkbM family methyltransferase